MKFEISPAAPLTDGISKKMKIFWVEVELRSCLIYVTHYLLFNYDTNYSSGIYSYIKTVYPTPVSPHTNLVS